MARRKDMRAMLVRLRDDLAMLIAAAGDPVPPTKDRLLRVTPELYDLLTSEYDTLIALLAWRAPRRDRHNPTTDEPDTDSESSTTEHSPGSEA